MPELKEFTGHLSGWKTLKTPPGTCQICATDHKEDQPHNKQSLVYQYYFYDKTGRWPTWRDALDHCSQETKDFWIKELEKLGQKID